MQGLGLRLLLGVWLETGRGWQRVAATLLGYAPPPEKPPLVLRVARAACLRDVCAHDSGRGVELVAAVQVSRFQELAPSRQLCALNSIALPPEGDQQPAESQAACQPAHWSAGARDVLVLFAAGLHAGRV